MGSLVFPGPILRRNPALASLTWHVAGPLLAAVSGGCFRGLGVALIKLTLKYTQEAGDPIIQPHVQNKLKMEAETETGWLRDMRPSAPRQAPVLGQGPVLAASVPLSTKRGKCWLGFQVLSTAAGLPRGLPRGPTAPQLLVSFGTLATHSATSPSPGSTPGSGASQQVLTANSGPRAEDSQVGCFESTGRSFVFTPEYELGLYFPHVPGCFP